jgi:hypothetical protein
MKKILITREEKNRIMESHNSYRNVLMGHLFDKSLLEEQEQNPRTPNEVLDLAVQKCTRIPAKQKATFEGKPALFYRPNEKSIDNISGAVKWESGDNVYFLGDMTWVSTFKDNSGNEIQRYVGRWSCKDLNVEAANLEMLKNQYITNFGWKEYNTLSDQEKALVQKNPAAYEIVYLATEPRSQLVRNKVRQQRGAVGDDQTSKVNSYLEQQGMTGVEWKFEKDLTIPQREEWMSGRVVLGPPVFDENIVIYMNPTQRGAKQLAAATKQQRQSQSLSEGECAKNIREYYLTWKEGADIAFSQLDALKKNVKKCMRLGHNYKTAGIGGSNVRKMITAMYGRPTNDNQIPTFDFYGGDDSAFTTKRNITDPQNNKLYSFDFNLGK